jgi:hypothetical protein
MYKSKTKNYFPVGDFIGLDLYWKELELAIWFESNPRRSTRYSKWSFVLCRSTMPAINPMFHSKQLKLANKGVEYLKSAPVIQELPYASKNTVGALKSSGAPSLPRRAPAIHVFSKSGSLASNSSVIAVLMYPGDNVFTRMPC